MAAGFDRARAWRSHSVLGIGEAMLEFAATGGDNYRLGYAGDTFNTCWYLASLLDGRARVDYLTTVGHDGYSDQLVAFMSAAGIGTQHVARDAERMPGLYVISLVGAERHFNYWRDQAAARRLADDPARLAVALAEPGLIHVSGITLAVVGEAGRRNLVAALREARQAGAVVSFDPNVRRRLWPTEAELRRAMRQMLEVVDIALPSFDDEAALWGDPDPQATIDRLEQAGIAEVAVKDGARAVAASFRGMRHFVATPSVARVVDTTGAGDSFNAGYIAARLLGLETLAACRLGQQLAGIVIGHHGALAPIEALGEIRRNLPGHTARE